MKGAVGEERHFGFDWQMLRLTPCRLWLLWGLFPMTLLATSSATAALGPFEASADVGAPKIKGSATYQPDDQTLTLTAGGVNMWGERDEFHFVWKKLKGDFIVRTRVAFHGPGVDPHRKAGWMVRPNLDDDAPYADTAAHAGDGLTSLQFRRTKGGETEQIVLPVEYADVVQFERRGHTYIFSAARFGKPFVHATLDELDLGEEVYVGLYLCSHDAKVEEAATFRDIRFIRPAPAGLVQYRDYLGSNLEILDIQTGHRRLLHATTDAIEAPNWTPDGATLIFNISGSREHRGQLRRFDLATGRIEPIDTGFANRNNNDHVLSFDGQQLGISHHSAEHEGRSMIYTLPVTGGTPQLITRHAPSYLHGWSPDGQWLVYTGGRNGKYDIYKIPSGGGEEIRLTHGPGLSDGPEYSPDGAYIYFNSTRHGTMQLWRMRPDGSEQHALTDDSFNNWFPHPSPDGKWIAFLSYLADVPPAEHPYYRPVYLRLMPVSGGPARVIAYVYGGQGTINVPSWSPDSRHVAFVSNTGPDA
jgi:TolB protein